MTRAPRVPHPQTVEELMGRIIQRQSLYRLSFDDRKVTREMLRRQAVSFEEWLYDLAADLPGTER